MKPDRFVLRLAVDNPAFQPAPNAETARLLEKVSAQVAAGFEQGSMIDFNGNVVGYWAFDDKGGEIAPY